MSKFLAGLICIAFVTPIFIMCLVIPGEQRGGVDLDIGLFIFFTIFELVGLYLLISGLITIIKDKKTKKHGIECYGIIRDIKKTGTSVNNRPEYKAIVDFVNPETYELETLEEIVGFDYTKYYINSYVLCKYYKGDINLEERIYENNIPESMKKMLIPIETEKKETNTQSEEIHNVIESIQKVDSILEKTGLIFKRLMLVIIIAILFISILFDTSIIRQTIRAKDCTEVVATYVAKKRDEKSNIFDYYIYTFTDKQGNQQEIVEMIPKGDTPQPKITIKYNESNPKEYYGDGQTFDTLEIIWVVAKLIIIILLILLFFNKKLLMKIHMSVR